MRLLAVLGRVNRPDHSGSIARDVPFSFEGEYAALQGQFFIDCPDDARPVPLDLPVGEWYDRASGISDAHWMRG